MAFTERHKRNDALTKQTDFLASNRATLDRKPESVLFYEFEPAIVVDAIYDEKHPIVSSGENRVIVQQWPKNLDDTVPTKDDTDYTWIGKIQCRLLVTDRGVSKEELHWASPLEITGVTEIPLINEVVAVVEYLGKYFYTKRINLNGFINASANFMFEPYYSGTGEKLKALADSTINVSDDGKGSLGDTFTYNEKIRALKRYEGDTIIESRFGSSIRFGGYGPDKGTNESDYGYSDYPKKTGNPWVLIRNRQADADKENEITKHPATYVTESINNDGSSIHLTSGATVSDFKTTCKKVMLQVDSPEEQPAFSPSGLTSFSYPKLDGDQVIVNSDRLVFQARKNEFFQYSKKRFSLVTDDEFTIDSHKNVVITTNGETVINSPVIFLGEANQTGEPALLGRTTTDWLMAMCEWQKNACDWQIELCNEWLAKHEHDTKKDPTLAPRSAWVSKMNDHVSAMTTLKKQMQDLQDKAPKNMSQRVYLVGGGAAPGQPGADLK